MYILIPNVVFSIVVQGIAKCYFRIIPIYLPVIVRVTLWCHS